MRSREVSIVCFLSQFRSTIVGINNKQRRKEKLRKKERALKRKKKRVPKTFGEELSEWFGDLLFHHGPILVIGFVALVLVGSLIFMPRSDASADNAAEPKVQVEAPIGEE